MADDDGHGAGVLEHFGGDVAGVGTGRQRVAVLAADRDTRSGGNGGKVRDQRRRRTHHQLGLGQPLRAGNDFLQFADRALAGHSFSNCRQPADDAPSFVSQRVGRKTCDKTAVSRRLACGKEAFYQEIPSVAGPRVDPYDAPPLPGSPTGTLQRVGRNASRYPQSLRQLARPRRHGRGHGTACAELCGLGHQRHLSAASAARRLPRSAAPKSRSSNSDRSTTSACSSWAAVRPSAHARNRPTHSVSIGRCLAKWSPRPASTSARDRWGSGCPDADVVQHVSNDPMFQSLTAASTG